MNFRNPKLKKLPEAVIRRRMDLYLNFNQFYIKLMPYISKISLKKASSNIIKDNTDIKSMILLSIKNNILKNALQLLPTGSMQHIEINRLEARNFIERGEVDHTGEFTIFGQLFT
jgi:hypothetical protein